MADNIDIAEKCHASDVLARLDHFRKTGQYCDFTIKCDAKEIPVHKCLIAASSEYFDAMLSHDTKENQDGVVEIKEVDLDSLVQCVDFMYTGKAVVSDGKQAEIIHVARLLQLQKLCDPVVTNLKESMNPNTYFSARQIANLYGFDELIDACNKFAVNNFYAIMKKEDFKDLDAEYLESLLSSKHMTLLEEVKCKALMTWVNNDSSRAASLFNLMKQLDIKKVQLSYRKFLLDDPIVFNSSECLNYIMMSMPEKVNVKPADYGGNCTPGLVMVNKTSRNLRRYEMEKNSWIEMHALEDNMATDLCSIIIVDQFLYLVDWDRAMFRIQFVNKDATWEKLSPPLNNCEGPLTRFNGKLYVSNQTDATKHIAQYDLAKDQWSKLTAKRLKTSRSCMTAARGKLFVIAGQEQRSPRRDDYESITDVECFDPITSTWSSDVSNLLRSRNDASACTYEDTIYVFSGWSDGVEEVFDNVEILYPDKSYWVLLKLSQLLCSQLISQSLNGVFYIFGEDDSAPNDGYAVTVFDPKSNSIGSVYSFTTDDFNLDLATVVVM